MVIWARWTALIVRVAERRVVLGGLLSSTTFVLPFAVVAAVLLPTVALWAALTGCMFLTTWVWACLNIVGERRAAQSKGGGPSPDPPRN